MSWFLKTFQEKSAAHIKVQKPEKNCPRNGLVYAQHVHVWVVEA